MPSPSTNRAPTTRVQNNAGRSPTSASSPRKVPLPHTVDASHPRACVQHAQDAPQDECISRMDDLTLRPLVFEADPRNRCDVGFVPTSPAKRRKRLKTSRLPAGAACCVLRASCFVLRASCWPGGPVAPCAPLPPSAPPGIRSRHPTVQSQRRCPLGYAAVLVLVLLKSSHIPLKKMDSGMQPGRHVERCDTPVPAVSRGFAAPADPQAPRLGTVDDETVSGTESGGCCQLQACAPGRDEVTTPNSPQYERRDNPTLTFTYTPPAVGPPPKPG